MQPAQRSVNGMPAVSALPLLKRSVKRIDRILVVLIVDKHNGHPFRIAAAVIEVNTLADDSPHCNFVESRIRPRTQKRTKSAVKMIAQDRCFLR